MDEQKPDGEITMEKTLKRLFDYQRFANNKRIADMIADTESRYNAAPLSDDMLELVSAAGEADDQSKLKKDGDTDDE